MSSLRRLACVACALTASALVQTSWAAPVISEVFYNPPSSSEAAFEWFEVHNPGPGELDLSDMVVISGSISTPKQGAVPANTAAIPVGGYAVLAKVADLSVGCRVDGIQVAVGGDFGLNNSTARVALFASGSSDFSDGNALDVVLYRAAGFPASTDGVSARLDNLGADNYIGSNWSHSPASGSGCAPYKVGTTGAMYGTPGRRNDWCDGAPSSEDGGAAEDGGMAEDGGSASDGPVCLPGLPDAGVLDSGSDAAVTTDGATGTDAGPGIDVAPRDAGPQNPPTISISEPSAAVTVNGSIDIVYSASDPDGDALSVTLFYDTDAQGNEGVVIADGLEPSATHVWQPNAVPAGTYHVFGRALDARGGVAYAYATGTVTVPNSQVQGPTLSILTPTGSEGETTGSFTIEYSSNGVPGSISLYHDVDQTEGNAVPIIGGLAVPGGPTRVEWETTEVESGSYFIYGRYETDLGEATAFSPGALTVQHETGGCGCGQSARSSSWTALALLLAALGWRRRLSPRR